MLLQPLVYFAAVIWAIGFAAYGLYAGFRRAPLSISERIIGLVASFLVGAAGSGAMIAGLYLIEELF